MKKGIFFILALFMLISNGVQAAPLNDYSKSGTVSLSVSILHNDFKVREKLISGGGIVQHRSLGNKWNISGEVTVTIAPRWAISLDHTSANANKKLLGIQPGVRIQYEKPKLQSTNLKFKYQVYKKDGLFVAPYLGISRNRASLSDDIIDLGGLGTGNVTLDFKTKAKISPTAGVTIVYDLDKKGSFKTYLDASVGTKMYSWNVGVSYKIAKNLDFNLGYQYYQASGLTYNYRKPVPPVTFSGHGEYKIKNKGIYLGVSYRFN